MNRREYLKTITEQIRCEKAREGIAKELNGHIEDQKETFLKEGMTETEAEEAAVREMGDPVAAGVELDRIHRPKMPWGLIALIGILHAAGFFLRHLLDARIEGVVFVSSGGSGILGEIVFLLAGLALMIGVCYLDYSRIGRYAKGIWWGAFVVLFPGVWFFGPVINGASWGAYGIVFNLQLVLFLALPLYGAILFQSRGGGYRTVAGNLFLISLPVLLCLGIPSAGNAIFLGGFLVVLMCLALWKGWYRVNRAGMFLAILGIFVGLPALLAVLWWKGAFGLPPLYQIERLRAIFRPSVYAPEIADWMEGLRRIFLSGKWIGSGKELPQDSYLAGDGGSYMLAYIAASFGLLLALVLTGLIGYLFFRLLQVSLKQSNQLGRMMGIGCTLVLAAWFGLYVLVNTGLLPRGSVYCPFLSFGNTGMLVTDVLLGILLGIYRYQNVPLVTTRPAGGKNVWRGRFLWQGRS